MDRPQAEFDEYEKLVWRMNRPRFKYLSLSLSPCLIACWFNRSKCFYFLNLFPMFFLNYSLDLFPSFWILNFYLKLFFCRVIVDNCSCQTATLVKVDSSNRHGILLEVVQILTDLDLWIRKAYISSDGGWFMDGNTLTSYNTNISLPFSIIISVFQHIHHRLLNKM